MHEFWEEQLPFYVAGTLPYAQARWLEKHLQTCSHCQHVLEEWRLIDEGMRSVGRQWAHGLPPLDSSVRHTVAMPQNIIPLPPRVLPSLRQKVRQQRRSRRFYLPVFAGVVCLLMIAGLVLYGLAPDDPSSSGEQIARLSSSTPTSAREPLVLLTNTPRPTATSPIESQPPEMRSSAGALTYQSVEVGCFVVPLDGVVEPVPVRALPQVESEILDFLESDERLSASLDNGLGWYEVIDAERMLTGWLRAETVRLSGQCEMFERTPTRRPTATPIDG